jgi:hypothetical protein
MQAWRGWTVGAVTAVTPTAGPLTWAAWCAWQQGTLRDERRWQHNVSFSERELARLSFLRWLYRTGRLGPQEQEHDKV